MVNLYAKVEELTERIREHGHSEVSQDMDEENESGDEGEKE